jgi:RNA polymerase sigma-70 factor (ECF subfamily)
LAPCTKPDSGWPDGDREKITPKGERPYLAAGYITFVASVAIADRGIPPDEVAGRLFQEHSGWLLGFCTRQLGGRADAEDAVQATFLYAFRALRRGVVPECERGWLTTIARNVCHTQRRTSRRHPQGRTELDLDRIALAQPDLEEAGFMDDVRAALSTLPENQRRALLMREWRGASSNEIATELQLSEPATHALLFRARKSFATALSASGRPFAGLNVAVLLDQLRGWAKPLLGGAAIKAAAVTTAAGVVVGGAVLEQRSDSGAPAPARPGNATETTSLPPTPRPAAIVERAGAPRTVPAHTTRAVERPVVARTSGSSAMPVGDGVTSVRRPPRPTAEQSSPPASPPAREAPAATSPSVEAPSVPPPPPVELPPILGEARQLPQPVEELLPPVELPPLPPLAPLSPPLPLP